MEINKIYNEDCLEGMKRIPDKSIDMILCDLPYGITSCKWDKVIPFEPLWEQYNRIIKEHCAIVLFGQEPFASKLRMSNLKMYKYDWVWDKQIPNGMTIAKIQPMRQTENVSVFINGSSFYYPQMKKRDKPIKSGGMGHSPSGGTMGCVRQKTKVYTEKFPTNLICFAKVRKGSLHPTQKPVELCEYLIKTYTNEGALVLDNCMGSGTTAVACINTNRNYIGFELDKHYFDVANERIEKAKNEVIR